MRLVEFLKTLTKRSRLTNNLKKSSLRYLLSLYLNLSKVTQALTFEFSKIILYMLRPYAEFKIPIFTSYAKTVELQKNSKKVDLWL